MITKFINWLEKQLGSIYVWGGQGEIEFNDDWIKKMETSDKNAQRAIALYKKRKNEGKDPIAAYDCSGLIVRFLLDNDLIQSDMSSSSLYSICDSIKRSQLKKGDFVFRHNGTAIHHVGVYVGDSMVIHAKGRDVGVVLEHIDVNGEEYWNRYARFDFSEEEKKTFPTIYLNKKGKAVRICQIMLNELGFICGNIDGVFGAKTQFAVKKFQEEKNLTVDGIVGEKTWNSIISEFFGGLNS